MSDRDDIIDLTIAYTWALDNKNIEGLRDVFLPDATADLRGRWCEGVDAIMARIGGSVLRFDSTQHLIGNHRIVVTGDTATSSCHLQSQHTRYGLEGGENCIVGGSYHDDLVRTANGWRIKHRRLEQRWMDGNPNVLKF